MTFIVLHLQIIFDDCRFFGFDIFCHSMDEKNDFSDSLARDPGFSESDVKDSDTLEG